MPIHRREVASRLTLLSSALGRWVLWLRIPPLYAALLESSSSTVSLSDSLPQRRQKDAGGVDFEKGDAVEEIV